MNSLLIKNGISLLPDKDEVCDILIRGNKIAAIAPTICESADEVIDATDCIVMPGLVNSHIHSHDNFNKGGFDNLPLETWMIWNRPFYSGIKHSEREVYIRTMIACVEMLKSGTTMVIDDVMLNRWLDQESMDAVMKAYRDSGMRAVVAPHIKNLPMHKTIPYLEELFPNEVKHRISGPIPSEEAICAFLESQLQHYNVPEARVTVGLSDSAPQRCTLKLLHGIRELSEKYGVITISHVLETYVQKRTGDLFYGKSLVRYMAEHDLLYSNHNLAHTIWVDEEDIQLLREYGVTTVHNPGCNLKMGSGIAPIKALRDAGIHVGLGSDNMSANDSVNMFEMMKLGALISKVRTPDPDCWLSAQDVLTMATTDGARCACMGGKVGELKPGQLADLVILNTCNERLACANDWRTALVYGENGASVRDVVVNGHWIVRENKLQTVDEESLYREARECLSMVNAERELSFEEGREIYPLLKKAYRLANDSRWPKGVL